MKKLVIFFSLLLFTLPVALAENALLNLTLYDALSRDKILNAEVSYVLFDKIRNISSENKVIVSEDGSFKLSLAKSQYYIVLRYDDLKTEGKDAYYRFDFDLSNDVNAKIFMLPIGSVKGTVIDANNNPVKDAFVRFDCVAEYGVQGTARTNDIGNFFAYYLPASSCRIGAAYDDAVGFSDANIDRGKLVDVKVKLNKEVVKKSYFAYYAAAFAIFALVFGAFLFRKKDKREIDKEEKKSMRTEDILTTLKENEREVVDFLLKSGNETTMAKVYYKTGIPKTSLLRIFQSLEAKKIIGTDRIGKVRRIRATKWFLNKEEKEPK